MDKPANGTSRSEAVRIVAIYALFGGLWIYLSDTVLGWMIRDPEVITRLSVFKGILFIVLTSTLLFTLISRFVSRLTEYNLQLQASEQRFQTIFNSMTDGVFINDIATGRIIDLNLTACNMFHYNHEEALKMDIAGISRKEPPYSQQEALEWFGRAQVTPQVFEWLCSRKDGTTFWTEISMRRALIAQDERIIVVVRDITERKQTEERLRLSEEKFSTAFRASPDSVNITRMTDGRYLEINEGFSTISGYSPKEVIGKTSLELDIWVDPEDRARLVRGLKEDGIVTNLEAKFRRKDGSILIGQMSARIIVIDGTPCILNITRDITEQREAEDALRKQEEELRMLMELMPVGVSWSDKDGRIGYMNRNFVELFGYNSEDLPTIEVWYQKAYPDPAYREDVVSRWRTDIAHTIKTGLPVAPLEANITCKDGTVRHVILNSQLTHNRTLVIFTDITEREHIQRELLKLQKLESLGVLAGGIAHDFNNILTGILGNISYARLFLAPDNVASKPLQEAERASKRAAQLAHQLLTFARGGQPVTKAVSPGHLLNESVSLVLRGSNIKAILDIPDDIHAINVDEGQISQAFNNIIINAVHAMPGGGTIRITADNILVNSDNKESVKPGEYVRIRFTDEGCGIPFEEQKKIFDPYYTTKSGGTGLGLASVYSIVSKHGGYIRVNSAPGKGTTFDMLLPATEGSIEPEEMPEPFKPGEHTGDSILVMDDDEMIRRLSEGILQEIGYRVKTCVDGKEAVELYKEAKNSGSPFAAVIMDLTIPGGMGGKEAAQQILAIDPDARLMVSSGYSNDPIMANYKKYGFSAAVIKPYKVNEIAHALSQLLRS